jgi:spermidine synthase
LLQGSICAVVLIGIPTLCMGATVPMLTRALAVSLERATGINARVYAFNTFGAVVGTLAAGFLAIRYLGLPGTVRLAGLLNLVAAVFFVGVGRRTTPTRTDRDERPATGRHVGASGYPARRRSLSPSALSLNQIAICLSLMPLYLTLDTLPYAAHLLRIRLGYSLVDFVLYQGALFVGLFVLLVLPAGLMGAMLPLAFDALKTRLGEVGRSAGALFAWNALGNLLGGLIGGYLVYRWSGLGEAFRLVVALAAVSAVVASLRCARAQRVAAGATALVALSFVWGWPTYDPLRFAVGTFHLHDAVDYSRAGPEEFYREFHAGRTVLAYHDDPEATLAVVENPRFAEALKNRFPSLGRAIVAVPSAFGEEGPAPRSILINGKADSSTFYDRETLRLAAHLPALLAPRRDRVLVVGLGTGVTVGELSLYPDVRSIEVAEISPGVARLLPMFSDWTHAVHDDPRLALHIGDAFRVIRRSDATWDLVISEPSSPWTSGIDQLYSREFYGLVRERLEPGGLLVQWMQRYATNEAIAAIVVNTLLSEFPHVRVFRAGSDDLLVASLSPLGPEAFSRADALIGANDAVRDSLAEIRVSGAADLISREHPEVIEAAVALARLGHETLDHPRLHFLSGLAFFRGDDPDGEALLSARP